MKSGAARGIRGAAGTRRMGPCEDAVLLLAGVETVRDGFRMKLEQRKHRIAR